ncbi:MAG: PilX N-terminal domain-containing pilus assembly protein, partial [Vicinamibacteria bacterium]
MTLVNQARAERGVALVMVLLLLLLISSLLVGFLVAVTTDTRLRGIDRTRTQAFYAAHAGLEKLTADLGDLFAVNFAPDAADLAAITDDPPALEHIAFEADDGRGYAIEFLEDATGAPAAENRTILSGPFQGFVGLVTPYTMTTTARTLDGSEARLQRTLQTVSIPVFQFGIFSETDLSFFAGPSFNFGGRVHTNGHLFLASGNNNTLTLADRVTVVNEVVRTHLSNGWNTSTNYTGTVRAITAPGSFRALARTEGSLVGTLGSAQNEPTWTNLSIGTYNGNVRNGRTGARRLDLPLITVGAQPIALIQRPVAGEPALVTGQRFFAQASVRILLSDTAEAMLDLPGVSADAPLPLGNLADTPIAGYVVDADRPPLAVSSGSAGDGYRSPAGTPLLGGFLKVEYTPDGETWVDVTLEWLNLGVTRRNIEHPPCAEPNPDAILRFQRVRATPSTFPADHCGMDSTEA